MMAVLPLCLLWSSGGNLFYKHLFLKTVYGQGETTPVNRVKITTKYVVLI
jgi:hypothetical protein